MFHTWTHDLTTGALPEQNGILLIFFSSRRVNWMTWTGRHGMSKFKIYGFHGHRLLVRSPRVQSIDSTSPATVREWKSWIADVATNNTHADGWLSKLISRWVSDWWTVSSWLGWFIAFQSNFDTSKFEGTSSAQRVSIQMGFNCPVVWTGDRCATRADDQRVIICTNGTLIRWLWWRSVRWNHRTMLPAGVIFSWQLQSKCCVLLIKLSNRLIVTTTAGTSFKRSFVQTL